MKKPNPVFLSPQKTDIRTAVEDREAHRFQNQQWDRISSPHFCLHVSIAQTRVTGLCCVKWTRDNMLHSVEWLRWRLSACPFIMQHVHLCRNKHCLELETGNQKSSKHTHTHTQTHKNTSKIHIVNVSSWMTQYLQATTCTLNLKTISG